LASALIEWDEREASEVRLQQAVEVCRDGLEHLTGSSLPKHQTLFAHMLDRAERALMARSAKQAQWEPGRSSVWKVSGKYQVGAVTWTLPGSSQVIPPD
jgi:hypothetical protein